MIPEQNEENVPTGSCPPSNPPAPQQPSNHPSARLSGRNNVVVMGGGRGPLVAMVLLSLLFPSTSIADNLLPPSTRPCSFNGKALHGCATHSATSAISSPVASSQPSSGTYVGNGLYRLTPNELANRKYLQLQLHNQQLIQRLQPHSVNVSNVSPTTVESTMTAFNETTDNKRILEDIYGIKGLTKKDKDENVHQMNIWLSEESSLQADGSSPVEFRAKPPPNASFGRVTSGNASRKVTTDQLSAESKPQEDYADYEDNTTNGESVDGNQVHSSGTRKTPPCANSGRFYCSYKEDYPIKVVTEVTRYYKWPLEKLFRDLRQQVMPKLANDNYGGLVCDSITRVIRPGWARNTANRWLVVINLDTMYQQYVTEVVCRHGADASCNFIPPCYQASCKQRFNTQKLLVIDPWNPYKGPFLSEFLFASCCVCYIPEQQPYVATVQPSASQQSHQFAQPPQTTANKDVNQRSAPHQPVTIGKIEF